MREDENDHLGDEVEATSGLRPAPEATAPIPLITQQDRFIFEGVALIATRYNSTRSFFYEEQDPTCLRSFTHVEILAAIEEGRAEYQPGVHSPTGSKAFARFGNKRVVDFSLKAQNVGRFYEYLIKRYREWCELVGEKVPRSEKAADLMPGKRSMDELLLEWTVDYTIQDRMLKSSGPKPRKERGDKQGISYTPPTVRTFNNIIAAYEACGDDIRALIPQQRGADDRHSKIECAESYAIWLRTADEFKSSRKITMAQLLIKANARIHAANKLRDPDLPKLLFVKRKRFENMIRKLTAFDVLSGREGDGYAHAQYKSKMGSYEVDRPGQRVEFDDWKMDVISLSKETSFWCLLPPKFQEELEREEALKPTRLWVVGAIDAATSKVLAMTSTTNPTANAVKDALEMVMSDKTEVSELVGAKTAWTACARPEWARTDNGANYIAEDTREAMLMSRVQLMRPPAGQPWKRPFIESLFRIFTLTFMPSLDGQTFINTVERRDYDSVGNATLLADELMVIFIRWICDVYHNTSSPKLNGLTPNEAWELKKKTYPMRPVPGRHEKRHIFGTRSTGQIRKEGIIKHGIPYNSDALQTYRHKYGSATKFPVSFHRRDLESISVLVDGQWLTVPNCIGMPPYISIEEWYLAKKELERLNEERSAESQATMYDALLWVHSVTDAASLRKGISPHLRTAEQMSLATQQLFEGRDAITAQQAGDLSKLTSPKPKESALMRGEVEPQPHSVLHPAPPKRKPKPMADEAETVAVYPNYDRENRDDEDSQFIFVGDDFEDADDE